MTSRDEGRSRRSSPERHYRRDHHSPQDRSPRPRGRSPQERNRVSMMEERKRSPDQRRRSDDDRKHRSSMSASPPVSKRYRSGRRRKNSNDDYSDGGRRKRRKRSHRSPERRGDRSNSRRRGSPMPPPPHARHRHYDDDPPYRRHRRRSTSLSSHEARAARRRGRRRYRGGRRARRRSGDSISSNSARRPPPPVAADVAPRAGVVSEDDDHLGARGALVVGGHTESRKPQSTTNTAAPAATKNNKRRSASSSRDDTVGHYKGREGSVIADRYRIIREVGVGTFGRVLECLDLKRSRSRRGQEKTVAIKVVRNVKRYYESALIEADIVEDVNRRGGRGVTHCAVMFDAFSFTNHYCMVFESLGPSLYDFLKRQKYQPFPVICVRDFAKQLLETLEFLHGFRLIHTDLKPENILLLNGREVSYKGYSIPECTRIKVIDFGGATYDNEKKSSVVNTRQYRAPEVILGVGWSMPSDLWSVGCILAELYQGELLFATHDNVEHLALIEQAIGPFPRRMLKKAKNTQLVTQAFDSMGAHRMALPPESLAYVKRIGPLEQLVFDDDTWFLRLLRRILVTDPEERATARECLRKF